ncbi:hypothetical protein TSHO111613_09965 [Tsukamurella hominis]
MGEVLLAEQLTLGRFVALKMLDVLRSTDDDLARRFVREALTLARTGHPNIVTIYDSGVTPDGRRWLSMEYVDGADAMELVSHYGPLPPTLVADIIDGVASALDHVWSTQRMVHRDVKPANIMVQVANTGTAAKTVKLADFGIAKIAEQTGKITRTGQTIGSVAYMAPEALDGKQLDNRADIYSLGASAFLMLTGNYPYGTADPSVIAVAHFRRPIPAPSDTNPSLSKGVDAAIKKALAIHPTERFDNATEFATALRSALTETRNVAQARDGEHKTAVTYPSETPGTPHSESRKNVGSPTVSAPGIRIKPLVAAATTIIAITAAVLLMLYLIQTGSTSGDATTQQNFSGVADVGHQPVAIAVDSSTQTGYVANASSNSVSVIDFAIPRTVATISLRDRPGRIALAATTQKLIVVNQNSSSVFIINTRTRKVETSIAVGREPTDIAIDTDGRTAYVANHRSSTVSVIDTESGIVTTTLNVANKPSSIAASRAGGKLFTTNRDEGSVSILDARSGSTLSTVRVGASPSQLSLSHDEGLLFVTDSNTNTISIIDTASSRLRSSIDVGQRPFCIATSMNNENAYVTTSNSSSLKTLDISSNVVSHTIALSPPIAAGCMTVDPEKPIAYILDPYSGKAYVVPITDQ